MTNYYSYKIQVRYYGKESPLHTLRLNAATSPEDARRVVFEARKPSKQTVVENVQAIARTTKPIAGLELIELAA
jgi:hypothetical protein